MKKILLLSATAFVIAACSSVGASHAPSFGQSAQRMHEAQSAPGQASSEAPEGGGASGALAQTRYKTGQTTPLMPSSTSSANPTSSSPQR